MKERGLITTKSSDIYLVFIYQFKPLSPGALGIHLQYGPSYHTYEGCLAHTFQPQRQSWCLPVHFLDGEFTGFVRYFVHGCVRIVRKS